MKVDHFGIVVPNLDVAIAFYRDALRCEVTAPVVREGQGLLVKGYRMLGTASTAIGAAG
jgi:catechol 2,3-dioxygenase-like lactoylglutathione lyase family enzyme